MADTNKRLTFYSEKTSLKEAKRQSSIHFNKPFEKISPVNEFNYVTSSGTYVFTRINKIRPNGFVIFGKWN